jgi:hypothetical protein
MEHDLVGQLSGDLHSIKLTSQRVYGLTLRRDDLVGRDQASDHPSDHGQGNRDHDSHYPLRIHLLIAPLGDSQDAIVNFKARPERLDVSRDGIPFRVRQGILVIQFSSTQVGFESADSFNTQNGSVLFGQDHVVVLNHPITTASRSTPMTWWHIREMADSGFRRP